MRADASARGLGYEQLPFQAKERARCGAGAKILRGRHECPQFMRCEVGVQGRPQDHRAA